VLYFEEAKHIWPASVPKSGQFETVQGELLRAVEKFRDEAIRNGSGNWDEGFESLLRYHGDHLLDLAVYERVLIETTRLGLTRLGGF
jgi:hypothetical protein